MTASITLTPYATDHGRDTLEGWAAYLHQRGDVPDETVIAGNLWSDDVKSGSWPQLVTVIYRTDPPRCELVSEAPQTATPPEVADAIAEALAAAAPHLNPATVSPDDHLAQDLLLDSLDMVELSMEIEERLGIDLSDVDVLTIHTLADLTALVTARVAKTTDMLAESLAAMRIAEEGEDHG